MPIANRLVLLASILSIVAGTVFSQEDVDLIDDLPKDKKRAAAKEATQQPPETNGAERKRPRSGTSPQHADGELRRAFERNRSPSLQPSLQPSLPGDEAKPPLPNTDLIDDLSPEQKRAAKPGAATKNASGIPENLADALSLALHNSPGILVAEAKVREAQAELNQVRQSVVHDLTVTYSQFSVNKKLLKANSRAVPTQRLLEVEHELREDEAKIIYLLGVGTHDRPAFEGDGGSKSAGRAGAMRQMGMGTMGPEAMGGMSPMGPMGPMGGMGMGSMMGGRPREQAPKERAVEGAGELDPRLSDLPEKMRRFLQRRVDMDCYDQPITDVLDYLEQVGEAEVDFVLVGPDGWKAPELEPVTLVLKQVTIAAALQALADLHECAFVFRDYGILVLGQWSAEKFDSYRAAGTPMISPPVPAARVDE